jgi:nucleoside phosphorylase
MANRKILFITANDNEFTAFREKFTVEKTKELGSGMKCFLGNFGKYKVWHYHFSVQGSKVQSEITNVIESIKPDAVILVGIACGGYKEKMGEVLVSEKIIDYDSHKISEKIESRGEVFTCGEVLYRLFQTPDCRLTWQSENNTKVHCGEMFCSSQLLNNPERKKEIFATRNNYPIGYEMEGITVVRACREFYNAFQRFCKNC